MAYDSGSAGDLAALRQALFDACTANGWLLHGNVLHKGNVYVEVLIQSGFLTVRGGTGIDGSNNLVGGALLYSRLGPLASQALTWPLAYEVFIGTAPDEVYLVVRFNVDFYEYLAFGASSITGLPGTGCWYSASVAQTSQFISIFPYGGGAPGSNLHAPPALFYLIDSSSQGVLQNSFIHHGFDAKDWSGYLVADSAIAVTAAQPHMQRLPNAWNAEGVLLPIQVYVPRPENKVSMVADLAHARYTRIDNYDPGQVVPLGPDRWKVFPWFRKNVPSRDGGNGIAHSGTMGWAVRYDGP